MASKRLETLTGAFTTVDRAELENGTRASLKLYLEQRGFAVYSSESTELLRETALEDFDGEQPKEKRPEPWCEPWSAGLASEPRAVAKRLGELLTALGNIDSGIVRGTLPDELRDFRIDLHTRLKAEGWRITAKQNGWKVLPPNGKKQ